MYKLGQNNKTRGKFSISSNLQFR